MRQGPYGAEALNAYLSRHFIGPLPICITRNSPDQNLYNGDTGHITNSIAHLDKGVSLPEALLPPYTLAFALSIHRAQGSEWDKTAILLPPKSERFGQELLYTAVTRARHEVLLFSSPQTITAMLAPTLRPSGLHDQFLALKNSL
jgi:exodeoxyribonuclease V alpha subunit